MSEKEFRKAFIELWAQFRVEHNYTTYDHISIDWFVAWLLKEPPSPRKKSSK